MKHRLSRKIISPKEAKDKIEMAHAMIWNNLEEICYWEQRLWKPLEPIDNFILMSDHITLQQAIDRAYSQVEYLQFKIYEDYSRYL